MRIHEHEFEDAPGLPEPLPPGERVLWQGAPGWRTLAIRVFHLRKLAIYFGVLVAWNLASASFADAPTAATFAAALWPVPLALLALALVALFAWLTSRLTVYTITSERVVMRIGIVLTITFNIPFRRIASAGLRTYPDGAGDIPLALSGPDRIAFLQLWPHARPWHTSRPEPMLRAIPDGARVAAILAQAIRASTDTATVAIARQPAPDHHQPAAPSLAAAA